MSFVFWVSTDQSIFMPTEWSKTKWKKKSKFDTFYLFATMKYVSIRKKRSKTVLPVADAFCASQIQIETLCHTMQRQLLFIFFPNALTKLSIGMAWLLQTLEASKNRFKFNYLLEFKATREIFCRNFNRSRIHSMLTWT